MSFFKNLFGAKANQPIETNTGTAIAYANIVNINTIDIPKIIAAATAEKNAVIKELTQQLQENEAMSHAERYRLGTELAQVTKERDFAEQKIQEMMREFDGKDLSKTSDLYRAAYALFIDGKIKEAIDFLGKEKIAKKRRKIHQEREALADINILKAQMLQAEYRFEEAVICLEEAVMDFPSYNNSCYADFACALMDASSPKAALSAFR